MIYVYDVECYFNFFSVIFKDVNTKEVKTFIIFNETNNLEELNDFINDSGKWFIGYNSKYYDNQMLNYISKQYLKLKYQTTQDVCRDLKELTDDIILRDYNHYKYNLPFKGID